MELFCRHCFQTQTVKPKVKHPHIEAICSVCENYIKCFNGAEKAIVIEELQIELETQKSSVRTTKRSKNRTTMV